METDAKIIVADDHPLMRNVLGVALRDAGFDVIEVGDGNVLLEEIRNAIADDDNPRRADLVITDVNMPECSGLQALDLIRRTDSKLPVIVMTAFGSPELHDDAIRRGATHVLNKPFDVRLLVALVRQLLA